MNIKGPMLFTQENLQKVIDGSKTQTRRTEALKVINDAPDEWTLCYGVKCDGFYFVRDIPEDGYGQYYQVIKPRHQVGDVLYLPEKHMLIPYGHEGEVRSATCQYTDGACETFDTYPEYPQLKTVKYTGKWRSPRFTYKFMARYFINVLGNKVEQLPSISPEDCIAEGIWPYHNDGTRKTDDEIKAEFKDLFHRSNNDAPWNSWVFAYTFEKI